MMERLDKITLRESLRSMRAIAIVLGGAALEAIDKRLDWVPDDTLEDARIKSGIFERMQVEHVEAPCLSEDELMGQLPLWENSDELENDERSLV